MTSYLLGASVEAPVIAFETAVLILVVVGLLLLAKSVLSLRSEVNALKRASKGSPGPAGSPGVSMASTAHAASPANEVHKSAPREIPPRVRAAIAAAIFATQGSHHRIVAISPAQSLIWSREGRRQVFESHRLR